jgi:ATP-dependent RNA helicase DDX27
LIVKSAKAQGAKIVGKVIESVEADMWADKITEMEDEIEEILKDEKEEKLLSQSEMQIRRGENIMVHEDEIKGRPKRTWFEVRTHFHHNLMSHKLWFLPIL